MTLNVSSVTKAVLLLCCTCLIYSCTEPKKQYNYGLTPVHSAEEYKRLVAQDSTSALINLEQSVPGVQLDIRYATTQNFVGQHMYGLARAYARQEVTEALKNAQKEFQTMGFSIVIFDAYRPYSVTVKFYEVYKDTTYVASPYSGSRHNRGAAIDLTLISLNTNEPLDMGTEYDDFSVKAHPNFEGLTPEQSENRKILQDVMSKNGFAVYPSEWWHFDYIGWEKYDILDLSFEQLEQI